MQLQTTQTLSDLDGNVIRNDPSPDSPVVTVRTILVNSLLMPRQEDATLTGEEKLKRFTLAQKIHDNDVIDISAEEVIKLKTLVCQTYSTLLYSRVALLLDPPAS